MRLCSAAVVIAAVLALAGCSKASTPTPAERDASFVAEMRQLFPSAAGTDAQLIASAKGWCDPATSPQIMMTDLEDGTSGISPDVALTIAHDAITLYCPKRLADLTK